jgi:hypothetical protein
VGRAPGIEASHDDARYVLLARSLRHLSYHNIWLADPTPHTLYPPGYPGFIAALAWVFGDAPDGIILLNVAASTAALGLTWLVLRRLWSPACALAVLAALACNPLLVERAGLIVSEPVAMAAWVATLALATGALRGHRVAAGAMALFAASARAFALSVPMAVAAHWLLERRWRAGLLLGGLGVAGAAGWVAWTAQAEAVARNVSYVADVIAVPDGAPPGPVYLRRIARHVETYATRDIASGIALPGIGGTALDNLVWTALIVAGLGIGIVVLFRRWRSAALSLLFGLGLLTLWPWREVRYLAPLLPVLVTTLLMGVESGVRWRWPRFAWPAVLALALVMAASGASAALPRVAAMQHCDRGPRIPSPTCEPARLHGFFAAVGWLREHGEAGTTVLAAKSATVHYFTGLPQADYGRGNLVRPEAFAGFVRDQAIRYVILSGSHNSELVRLAIRLEAVCAQLRTAARFPPNGYVFVVVADTAGADGCAGVLEFRRWGDATVQPDGEF